MIKSHSQFHRFAYAAINVIMSTFHFQVRGCSFHFMIRGTITIPGTLGAIYIYIYIYIYIE
jgi:hypothetical protein